MVRKVVHGLLLYSAGFTAWVFVNVSTHGGAFTMGEVDAGWLALETLWACVVCVLGVIYLFDRR